MLPWAADWVVGLLCAPTAGTLAGVIGVAVTGLVLDRHGGASAVMGWYMAHAVCAAVVVMSSFVFQLYARGEKLFD